MTRFSSKWIFSHSTWYKCRRSGQAAECGQWERFVDWRTSNAGDYANADAR